MHTKPGGHRKNSPLRASRAALTALRPTFALLLAALTLCLPLSSAADPICARVKIETKQELTLERQGFDAAMKITNSLDTTTLENVAMAGIGAP